MDTSLHTILVKALQISSLPEQEQQEMIASVGGIIYQAVLLRALEEMTEEQTTAFEKITEESTDPQTLFTFLRGNLQQFDQMIEEETMKFVAEGQSLMNK